MLSPSNVFSNTNSNCFDSHLNFGFEIYEKSNERNRIASIRFRSFEFSSICTRLLSCDELKTNSNGSFFYYYFIIKIDKRVIFVNLESKNESMDPLNRLCILFRR